MCFLGTPLLHWYCRDKREKKPLERMDRKYKTIFRHELNGGSVSGVHHVMENLLLLLLTVQQDETQAPQGEHRDAEAGQDIPV